MFAEIGRRIRDLGEELVKKVNAVLAWEILKDGKHARRWSECAPRVRAGEEVPKMDIDNNN